MNILFDEAEKTAMGKKLMEHYLSSNFIGSKGKFAKSVGLVVSDMTNLEHEKWKSNRSLIGDRKWITISRILNYNPQSQVEWKVAETFVKKFIFRQLELCQKESLTSILSDDAGIGKTFSAKLYAQHHKAVFYIDCSVSNRRSDFIRSLGKAVGIGSEGRLGDIFQDSIQALCLMKNPLLILDEAGDIDNKTILIVKQLYNALEGMCGIYAIGSDGLKTKIMRGVQNKRLGYMEFFSRFGKKFGLCLPVALDEKKEILKNMAQDIVRANGIHKESVVKEIVSKLFVEGIHDMRKIKREVLKQLKVND